MKTSSFVASLLVPGLGHLIRRDVVAALFILLAVLVSYGSYAIILDATETLSKVPSHVHFLLVLGLSLHVGAAVTAARE